jgi:hypothetical protein
MDYILEQFSEFQIKVFIFVITFLQIGSLIYFLFSKNGIKEIIIFTLILSVFNFLFWIGDAIKFVYGPDFLAISVALLEFLIFVLCLVMLMGKPVPNFLFWIAFASHLVSSSVYCFFAVAMRGPFM